MTFRTAKVNKPPEASLISAEKDSFSTLGMQGIVEHIYEGISAHQAPWGPTFESITSALYRVTTGLKQKKGMRKKTLEENFTGIRNIITRSVEIVSVKGLKISAYNRK